ncbi:MAG TPA: hypothetical protein VF796_30195, partial [Humisphaera sp.]
MTRRPPISTARPWLRLPLLALALAAAAVGRADAAEQKPATGPAVVEVSLRLQAVVGGSVNESYRNGYLGLTLHDGVAV